MEYFFSIVHFAQKRGLKFREICAFLGVDKSRGKWYNEVGCAGKTGCAIVTRWYFTAVKCYTLVWCSIVLYRGEVLKLDQANRTSVRGPRLRQNAQISGAREFHLCAIFHIDKSLGVWYNRKLGACQVRTRRSWKKEPIGSFLLFFLLFFLNCRMIYWTS